MISDRKPSYDTNWQQKFDNMIMSPRRAAMEVKPGQRVFIGTGCGQPQALVSALVERAGELTDLEIIDLLAMGDAPYAKPELAPYFRVNSFFLTEKSRGLVHEGLGDYTPIFLSDIPRLFSSGQLPLDVALIQVSPPDERGRASLGVSVDIVKAAAANASLVIAQVNAQMPRTLGDSLIDVQDVDILVPADEPVIEMQVPQSDDLTRKIGEFIAALVENGSTMELGIGRIPHAVLEFLADKHELGIHTEMLNDAIIDMMEKGVITGKRKSLDRGKVVASFCMGTRKLYDYIDNNPAFSFNPTEYVNDPFVIGQQHRMVAINTALEIDLTGQVCSDSIGQKFFSGIGGQVDFNRGAARSEGGKAIIALQSTAKDGTISRIVSQLTPGGGVVTSRGDVHYVVTEYGVAYLHGKQIQDRALALISIAHPDYREQLLREAVEHRLVRAEMAEVEGKMNMIASPDMRATYVLNDGTQINFRPTHPTDASKMRDLFYNLSQQTVYYRFMHAMKSIPHRTLLNTIFVDHRHDVAIVGTVPEASGDEIVAVGRYFLDTKTNRAEVAFTVRDGWQNRGIGKFLLKMLTTVARRNGIGGFTAEVLRENKPMQSVFNKSGLAVSSSVEGNVRHFDLDFA